MRRTSIVITIEDVGNEMLISGTVGAVTLKSQFVDPDDVPDTVADIAANYLEMWVDVGS